MLETLTRRGQVEQVDREGLSLSLCRGGDCTLCVEKVEPAD